MTTRILDHEKFSLARLRSFLKVYDAGGITNATRASHNPTSQQSQLSRQLSELREVFGAELFEGVGRARRPTALAHALARHVRDFQDGLEELGAGLNREPLDCRLGAGDSVLHWLVLPRLHEVGEIVTAAVARRVRWRPLALDNVDLYEQLADGRVDLGIVYGRPSTPGERRQKLGTLDYHLFGARRGRGEAPHWRTLLQSAPLAAVTNEPEMAAAVSELGVDVKSRCGTWPQVARAVRTGHWVGVLPTIAEVELQPGEFWSVPAPALATQSKALWLTSRPRLEVLKPGLWELRDGLATVLSQGLRQGAREAPGRAG